MKQKIFLYLPLILGFIVLTLVVYYSSTRGDKYVIHRYGGKTMGTTYTVKYRGNLGKESKNRLKNQTEKILQEINHEMSTWQENSVIARFNREQSLGKIKVTKNIVKLVEIASDISKITGGLYDVTISPLVDLWGFGRENERNKPMLEEILRVKEYVGIEKLRIEYDPPSLQKTVAGVAIDLSSIAKGFGVDAVADMLKREGLANYLVEIGGEVRVSGKKSRDQKWKVAIEKPLSQERVIQEVLNLTNISMATSGDYRNFFEEDGQRYVHIIDPHKGYPVKSRLASVTVFARNTTLADAWATALFVSGEDKARSLARGIGLPVLMILHTESTTKSVTPQSFTIELSPVLEDMWQQMVDQ